MLVSLASATSVPDYKNVVPPVKNMYNDVTIIHSYHCAFLWPSMAYALVPVSFLTCSLMESTIANT